MSLKTVAILTLTLALSGCSSGSGESESSSGNKYSKAESCKEAIRLMGKATDQMLSPSTNDEYTGNITINLLGVAQEFRNLALKTQDTELSTSLNRISESLKKMSSDSTFFEGNSIYLAEISTFTSSCS